MCLTLTACTTDSIFEDIDQQNAETGSQYQTNSFNDNDSGYVNGPPGGVKEPGINYYSPWDIWFNRGSDFFRKQPAYTFWNGNVNGGGEEELAYSPYTLEVHAWVGLAYFDGDDNGDFYDISPMKSGNPPLLVAPMGTSGNYPNLYANGHEVGNLVQMQPFIINPMESFRMEDDIDHLPMGNNITHPQYQNWFTFPGGLTPQEEILLRDYGKVFFYEVNVFEAGTFIGNYILHPEIATLPGGLGNYWEPVLNSGTGHVQGNMPALGSFDLYYINHPVAPWTLWNPNWGMGSPDKNQCDSHEVVFRVPMPLQSHDIIGGSVPKTIGMGFAHHPFTLWQGSSLDLRTY